jgi:predicted RNase H-like nuclease
VLFDLPRIPQYKAKPGRDVGHLRSELLRLVGYLASLADASPPLLLKGNAEWEQIRSGVETARTKAGLKRREDAIDGVVCANLAAYASINPTQVHRFGDAATGYILTPITSTIAAQLLQT